MNEVIQYIIEFLVGEENKALADYVVYGNETSISPVLLIKPSDFFDKNVYLSEESLPSLPLNEVEGIPILFGTDEVEKQKNIVILHADLIASAFFLLSRYEECVRENVRDEHGRFLGKNSILFRANCIMRPLVDEYGHLIRKYFQEMGFAVKEHTQGYNHIYTTHDVDQIWQWNNFYYAIRTFTKRLITRKHPITESIMAWCNYEKYDEVYNFPWLVKQDNHIRELVGNEKATSIYFIMTAKKSEYDTGYIKRKKRVKKLIELLLKNGAVLGLHASYAAGIEPLKVKIEKKVLEDISNQEITCNRNHYLDSREPEDMRMLEKIGIVDDYTMGYADVVGFRLGTCHSVKWIDPKKMEITNLILHPMTVMECTLDGKNYMNLNEEEAYTVVCKMLDSIYTYSGEVVLLWHNTSFLDSGLNYQKKMYPRILKYIEEKYYNRGKEDAV